MEEIASVPRFEEFYKDIFELYNVFYSTETIRQKRTFVALLKDSTALLTFDFFSFFLGMYKFLIFCSYGHIA